MSLTDRAYEVVADVFGDHEEQIMTQMRDHWPLAYAQAVVAQHAEDPDYDGHSAPNLSVLCEQIAASDEDAFLASLQDIVGQI